MDNEQARFVLRSFRPDGADVNDPDFAEALKLAMENRELGEWLAHERAFDAAFAKALGSVNLPENLREDIMGCLAMERGDFPQAEDANDAAWIGALASIQPPASLRDEVLAAMDRTVTIPRPNKISIFRRLAIPLAAAAGIALAFLITRQPQVRTASIDDVRSEVIRTLQTHGSVREEPVPAVELVKYLDDRKMPRLAGLPAALQQMKGFACRELVVDEKHGTLLCFDGGKKNVVHMVVFRREDVQGDFPENGKPVFAQNGDWATARWTDGENVAIMVSNTRMENLSALF